jgi:hypothetical protein
MAGNLYVAADADTPPDDQSGTQVDAIAGAIDNCTVILGPYGNTARNVLHPRPVDTRNSR